MAWFIEGMAQFVGLSSLIKPGLTSAADARTTMLQRVSSEAANLGLQGLEYRGQPLQVHPGPLGYLGVEFLVSRAPTGVISLRTYCSRFASSPDAAFEEAFGLSLQEFYEQFAVHFAQLRGAR
jgi:hypothetical protein